MIRWLLADHISLSARVIAVKFLKQLVDLIFVTTFDVRGVCAFTLWDLIVDIRVVEIMVILSLVLCLSLQITGLFCFQKLRISCHIRLLGLVSLDL